MIQQIKFNTFFVSNRFLKISSTRINVRIIGIRQKIRFVSISSITLLYISIYCCSQVAPQNCAQRFSKRFRCGTLRRSYVDFPALPACESYPIRIRRAMDLLLCSTPFFILLLFLRFHFFLLRQNFLYSMVGL